MEKITKDDILASVLTSKEVIEVLGISRARLSQLVKNDKLRPLKKNLFLLDDVMSRKTEQEELRRMYYRPRGTDMKDVVENQKKSVSFNFQKGTGI